MILPGLLLAFLSCRDDPLHMEVLLVSVALSAATGSATFTLRRRLLDCVR